MENCKFSPEEPCHPIACLTRSFVAHETVNHAIGEHEEDDTKLDNSSLELQLQEENLFDVFYVLKECAITKVNALRTLRHIEE